MVLGQASLRLALLHLLWQLLHVRFLIDFTERILIIVLRLLIILANAAILAAFVFLFLFGGVAVTVAGPILSIQCFLAHGWVSSAIVEHVYDLEDLVGLEVVHLLQSLDVLRNVREPADRHGHLVGSVCGGPRAERLGQIRSSLRAYHGLHSSRARVPMVPLRRSLDWRSATSVVLREA